jgi:hypothetical protein
LLLYAVRPATLPEKTVFLKGAALPAAIPRLRQ